MRQNIGQTVPVAIGSDLLVDRMGRGIVGLAQGMDIDCVAASFKSEQLLGVKGFREPWIALGCCVDREPGGGGFKIRSYGGS